MSFKPKNFPDVTLCNYLLKYVNVQKYLGVLICSDMSDDVEMKQLLKDIGKNLKENDK